MLKYISNADHFKEVLSRVQSVKHMLWIGTADIKDLYVEMGKEKKPFLDLIAQLIRHGVEVRLIHAKEPGPNFREDFDKYPVLYDTLCVSRRVLPDLENHQLQTVATECGYSLENHHNALADAEACAWIAREIL